jgi:hypothetical protein
LLRHLGRSPVKMRMGGLPMPGIVSCPTEYRCINRFGMYTLNPNRIPDPLEQYLRLLPASEGVEIPPMQQSVSF